MDLSTNISGIELKNPLMPASGPLVGDDRKMKSLYDFGVGCMVTKTISSSAAKVPRPCIYSFGDRIVNAELWSEYEPLKWCEEILPNIKSQIDIPLIISLGYTREDMKILVPLVEKYADAFEISTHYSGTDCEYFGNIVKAINEYTDKPVFMKISPHQPNPVLFAETVKECGAAGIVAINSMGPTMAIDIKKRGVLIGNDKGLLWSSGPIIKPSALSLVNIIKSSVKDICVIGTGGIKSADDVIEFLLAGADAVQLLSSALLYGKDIYEKILLELPIALQKYGFSSIEDVKNNRIKCKAVSYKASYPIINEDKCISCGLCQKVCPYFAIEMKNKPVINNKECFGCGLCQSRCPKGAISGVVK